MKKTKIPYNFPTEEIKYRFKMEAAKNKTTIVAMITKALKKSYKELF